MKNFSNASFPPETISIMKDAMDAAVATLPDPVSLAHVNFDSGNCPPQCQRWRERPSNVATNGAIGTSNYAAQLNGGQVKKVELNSVLSRRIAIWRLKVRSSTRDKPAGSPNQPNVSGKPNSLSSFSMTIFFPEQLWGKNLAIFFDEIFRKKARFCVMYVSKEYQQRVWRIHEARSAQARAVAEKGNEYILPIQVDEIELEGLLPTIGYVPIRIGILRRCW
jgi:hypothetical protein